MSIGTGGYVEIGGVQYPVASWAMAGPDPSPEGRAVRSQFLGPPTTFTAEFTIDWCLSQYACDRLGLELARRTRPFVARPRRLVGWLFPGEN